MSNERDLLKKILATGWLNNTISCEVEELLAQPEHIPDVGNMVTQEPVAWIWEELDPHSGEWYEGCVDEDKPPANQYRRNIRPLYTSPPKRDPLSDTRCPYPEETSGEYRDGFTDGILYAEKAHGIGGEE